MPLGSRAQQPFDLTLDKMLAHAAKWHPTTDVVTAVSGASSNRTGYAEIYVGAKRVSAALKSLGIDRGDVVATLAWNTQSHLECWYGIMGMGSVCHTLNPRLDPAQLAWMTAQSSAKILIVSSDLAEIAEQIIEHSETLQTYYEIDRPEQISAQAQDSSNSQDFASLLSDDRQDVPWGEFDEKSACGLCFTSGTTGRPKGVVYTHRGLFLHSLRQLQADVSGLTSQDVVLPVVPMFHANAWGLPFSAPATGAGLILPGRNLDGKSLAKLIAEEQVTIAVGVPTVWKDLFDYLEAEGMTLPSLKRIMVGGAAMPPALMARIEAQNIGVQTSWGMTELSPLGTAMPPGEVRRADSAGRPALGVDLMVSDENGDPLKDQRNQEGRLWVKGASVLQRYLGADDDATRNGWFPTGDLAKIDEQGHLIITGRSKDLIKSGGEWINPVEIESIVNRFEQIALPAVVGRKDQKWGERPILLIELRENALIDDDDLINSLKGKVPSWWIPDAIIRIDAMPLAATGKINKIRLRELYGS